jgi:hypothetical protein
MYYACFIHVLYMCHIGVIHVLCMLHTRVIHVSYRCHTCVTHVLCMRRTCVIHVSHMCDTDAYHVFKTPIIRGFHEDISCIASCCLVYHMRCTSCYHVYIYKMWKDHEISSCNSRGFSLYHVGALKESYIPANYNDDNLSYNLISKTCCSWPL